LKSVAWLKRRPHRIFRQPATVPCGSRKFERVLAHVGAPRGLGDALSGKTAAAAVVLVDVEGQSRWVVNAIRATAADTEKAIREMQEQKAMTRRAIKLLGSESGDAYQAALAALRGGCAGWVGR
jgi:hypothetical protein